MITLVKIELYKIFKKWRTYIGFIAIGVLVSILHIAMIFQGSNTIDFMTQSIRDSFVFVGSLLNGYFLSYLILNSLVIHIPFLIALVAGDLLAGEATAGTYRLLLTRPVSRTQVVTAKFFAAIIYTNLLILWLAFMSMVIGIIIFGTGELLVLGSQAIIIFEKTDVIWRFLCAYAFASLGMSVIAALAFLFSSLVENAIGPIVTTMAVIIVFLIISNIQIDFFQAIKPYLFTNYILSWRLFFDDPIDVSEILKAAAILLGHILFFYSLTLYLFKRKDILT